MEKLNQILLWAKGKGVRIHGIQPSDILDHGVGMVATRDLQAGDVIMTVPIPSIRSLLTIPIETSMQLHPDMSIHGLLASELALQTEATDWMKAAPSFADLEASVPYMWPEELQRLLPREATDLLAGQQTRFERDWDMFASGFPQADRRAFLHSWFLVNSRGFYYETPETMLYPWLDRLALLPAADLFNHSASGCSVSFSEKCYTIAADRPYVAGEELFTSYGEHSNDLLLADYGFMLDENPCDQACLDDIILPKLTKEQKAQLKERNLLGGYMLKPTSKDSEKTRIALRLMCSTKPHWESLMDDEEDDEGTKAQAADMLAGLMDDYMDTVKRAQDDVRASTAGSRVQRSALARRWEQIEGIVKSAMDVAMQT